MDHYRGSLVDMVRSSEFELLICRLSTNIFIILCISVTNIHQTSFNFTMSFYDTKSETAKTTGPNLDIDADLPRLQQSLDCCALAGFCSQMESRHAVMSLEKF